MSCEVATVCTKPADQLSVAFDGAGLERREKHILRERLKSRSYAAIAGDKAMNRPYTRQRLQQLERGALAKLGIKDSLETIIRQSAAATAMETALKPGRDFVWNEVFADPRATAQSARTMADEEEQRLDAWVDHLMAIAKREGSLSARQRAEFDRRIRSGERAPGQQRRRPGRPRQ